MFVAFCAVLTRFYALYATRGVLHPDNLYQLLEPAHRFVFGYGIIPWEYVLGMRSWLQPLLIAGIFKIGLLFGVWDIESLILINRAVMVVFSLALLYVVYETALLFYGRKAALYASFFSVFSYVLWLWSADVNPHVPSALFSTVALYIFFRGLSERSRQLMVYSGLSLGAAFMFRFDALLFVPSLALYALYERKPKDLTLFFTGFAAMVVAQGLLDLYTWGVFLKSPIAFFTENILKSRSSMFGTLPFYFYLGVLGLHQTSLFLLPYAAEKKRESIFLALNAGFFILAYSLVSHKEMRFIIPALPPFFILAGRGLERMVALYGKRIEVGVVVLTVFLTSVLIVGSFPRGDAVEALRFVGSCRDSTGVGYFPYWWNVGGYTYLHKKMPLVFIGELVLDPCLEEIHCSEPDMWALGFQCSPLPKVVAEPGINYVITENESMETLLPGRGFEKVQKFGRVYVYRRSD